MSRGMSAIVEFLIEINKLFAISQTKHIHWA